MDLLQIRTLASQLMEDEGFNTNSAPFYDSNINEAQRRLAEITRIHYKKATSSSVNGDQRYLLPPDFMSFQDHQKSVRYENITLSWLIPTPTTYQYLDNSYDDLHSELGDPKMFWLEDRYIGFFPTPDFNGTDNIVLTYFNYSVVLVNDVDICDFSDRYLYPLAYTTCQLIYERNERPRESLIYKQLAGEALGRIDNSSDEMVTENVKRTHSVRYTG